MQFSISQSMDTCYISCLTSQERRLTAEERAEKQRREKEAKGEEQLEKLLERYPSLSRHVGMFRDE